MGAPIRKTRVLIVDDSAIVRRMLSNALQHEPASFVELMAALGSRDGREIVRALDALYAADRLGRRDDGRYVLKDQK